MIDIKTISGELLLSVPILQDAVCHEELMVSDYVALSWNSDNNEELPAGAYIEFEGERYSLLEPYKPTMVTEGEFKYAPQFHSRVSAWDKQPACVYTYESDGVTVKTREFDWTIVGSPADAMQIIKQAIKNETGEEWNVKIAESLPASIEISSQTSSIKSVLASIADQCQTEYWVEKATNTLHLSKCEFGEEVALEVGSNIGVPSVMMGGNEYYTRYYALGSSRNITQGTAGINGSVNKRLTLDPTAFPHGYKDVKGYFENGVFVSDLKLGEIFSKVVVFDDIYPSSDLEIYDVRARMKYRLDGDGKKIKIGGTDENPVFDQYSIWYFKIKDFSFNSDSLIEGLPLSVHFKSGRLSGQEFELIYHDKAKTENTNGDVGQFNVEVGDYEIKFKESSGVIIPDIAYIIPQSGDRVTLYNIEMPKEYTSSAQQRLLEALDKHIEKEHSDSNTYEFSSNPVAFYESELTLSVGQKVSFVNGEKTLETRTLMVERKLDYPCEQKIRIGSGIIKGSTKELRENVESLNHNVDVLAAFNDLSKSIQDSYGRNQALVNEAISSLLGIWYLDESGNIVTDKQVVIKNNLIVEKDTSSGGTGQDTPSAGLDEEQLQDYLDLHKYVTESRVQEMIDEVAAGDVDLTNYYTKQEVDAKIPSLEGYAKEGYVDDAITALNVGQYAKASDLENLQGEVDNIETVLGLSETAEGYINTWAEVVAFLDGYKNADDLATILSGINADIAKKADKATTLAGYGITDAYTKSDLESYKTWWDAVMGLVVKDGNNIRIKTNLIIEGDTSSGGSGQDTPASGTVTGIKVSASETLTPNNAGIIDMVSVLSSIDVSDQLKEYAKLTDITKTMVDSVLGSTAAGNANRFLMSTGSTSVWAAITKDMVTDALGYTPLSTGGGRISGNLDINSETDTTRRYFRMWYYASNRKNRGMMSVSENEVTLDYYSENDGAYYQLLVGRNGLKYVENYVSRNVLHSGNYADYALPLSGGTITGLLTISPKNYLGLVVDSPDVNLNQINLKALGELKGIFQYNATYGVGFHYQGKGGIYVDVQEYPRFVDASLNVHTLIHSGNIGSYKAGDSAKLGGYDASVYPTFENQGTVIGFNLHTDYIKLGQGDGHIEFYDGGWYNSMWGKVTAVNGFVGNLSGNATSATYASTAKTLVDAQGGKSVVYVSGNTFYIGDSIYPTTSTQILGNDVRLRYGTSASYGLILNSSGNVTIGGSDLAGTAWKMYVNGKAIYRDAILADRYNGQGNTAGASIVINKGDDYFGMGPSARNVSNLSFGLTSDTSGTWKSELLTIAQNGNVLIGTTTNSGYKLDVAGTGRFTGAVTITGVASVGVAQSAYNANRAQLSVISSTTEPAMLWLGSNSEKKWSIESRGSGDNYRFSLYSWVAAKHLLYITHEGDATINGNLVVSGDIAAA